jgi:WXG100 family type VII secretion target
MSSFKVTPDQLESTARSLEKAKDEVQAQLTNVGTQVTNVASVWEGAAQAEFKALMDRWQKASKELAETLGIIHRNLAASAANYRQAEDEAKRGFQAS